VRPYLLSVAVGLAFALAVMAGAVYRAGAARPRAATTEGTAGPGGSVQQPPGVASVVGRTKDPGPLAAPGSAHVAASDLERLRAKQLLLPVAGIEASELRDNYSERRGSRAHEALDILAPRGTPVLAVDDGRVARLFTSVRGGLTVYQFDPSETFCYYYAHLDGYAPGLDEGDSVRRGSLLGYVGTTGNAPPGTPHLHFTVFKLGAEKRWWEGAPINPFPVWVFPE
jgi:murein DD-endopeptidase MepM/ murein hydrolase activator NlpD